MTEGSTHGTLASFNGFKGAVWVQAVMSEWGCPA